MKKILKNKLFMYLTFSDLISNFGDTVYYLALMNYVLFLENPSLALSIIAFSETLPIGVRLFTGYISDKIHNKIKVIKLSLMIRSVMFMILGYMMRFNPNLWIVVVASVISFLSSVAGQLENGLYIPIHLRIIENEERGKYMGFTQSLHLSAYILFQPLGALLISLLSFSHLAYLNAFTFLIPLGIIILLSKRLNHLFDEKPIHFNQDELQKNGVFKNMINTLKLSVSEMKKIPDLNMCMIIVPIINGLFAVFPIIITLIMASNVQFIIKTPAITLAMIQTSHLIGAILGGVLVMSLFKNLSIYNTLKISMVITVLLMVSLFLQQVYIMIILFLILGIVVGGVNPKLQTLIFNRISEDKIATVSGGIATYFQMGMIIMKMVVSGLLLVLNAEALSLIMLLIALIFLGYVIFSRKEVKN